LSKDTAIKTAERTLKSFEADYGFEILKWTIEPSLVNKFPYKLAVGTTKTGPYVVEDLVTVTQKGYVGHGVNSEEQRDPIVVKRKNKVVVVEMKEELDPADSRFVNYRRIESAERKQKACILNMSTFFLIN
jgi:hypothetical protein